MNLASTEFPLLTNKELAHILTFYNGSNEIEIVQNISPDRIQYSWFENKKSLKLEVKNRNKKKEGPPHGFVIKKGYANVVIDRKFAEYVIGDSKARDLLKWGEDTYSPDEWYKILLLMHFSGS